MWHEWCHVQHDDYCLHTKELLTSDAIKVQLSSYFRLSAWMYNYDSWVADGVARELACSSSCMKVA